MDVLYYIGTGSMHNNEELRYSLRALEKHCQDVDNVWVVGNKPPFLNNNVKYVWVEDGEHWYHNSIKKIVAAIEAGISDNFLLMNDDFFMLEDFSAKDYPAYHRGNIKEEYDTEWHTVLSNTKKLLEKDGVSFRHYGVHCPMVINGKNFISLDKYFGEKIDFRCVYGNYFCKGRKVSDCKSDEIRTSETKCCSTKPWAPKAIKQLREMFPDISKWEK